jgi:hypothetical protein
LISLLLGALAILILFAADVVTAPVPIGTILLLAVAGLVGFASWRWAPILGVLMALSIFVGSLIAPGLGDRLSSPGDVGAFVGSWLETLALPVAIVAGVVMTAHNYRPRPTDGLRSP